MITVILCIIGYVVMMSATFVGMAKATGQLQDPWETPTPFFSALFWPIVVPFAIPTAICARMADGGSRTERRREKELAEANHKQRLARINAETMAVMEREAGLNH